MGLGVIACGAHTVTDEMFLAAGRALSALSPARADRHAALLPPLADIRQVSRHIALAVGAQAQRQGLAEATTASDLERRVDAQRWEPRYACMRKPADATRHTPP
jgi:malate dehydrogenase (oxaloacetate-decarboxylating)